MAARIIRVRVCCGHAGAEEGGHCVAVCVTLASSLTESALGTGIFPAQRLATCRLPPRRRGLSC